MSFPSWRDSLKVSLDESVFEDTNFQENMFYDICPVANIFPLQVCVCDKEKVRQRVLQSVLCTLQVYNQSISAATSAVESAQNRLEEDTSFIDTYSIDANFIDAFFIDFDVEAAQALCT